jgi:hypothetical protein
MPPSIITAEIKYRCPGAGIKKFVVVGPTADEALRKAARFDTRAPGVPRYLARCRPAGIELVRRHQGFDGAAGPRVRSCPRKLHADIRHTRANAYDSGSAVADMWAKTAEAAARDGRCAPARKALAKARAAVRKARR